MPIQDYPTFEKKQLTDKIRSLESTIEILQGTVYLLLIVGITWVFVHIFD